MLAVARLVDTCADLNVGNKNFLQPAWRKSLKATKSTPLRIANRMVVSVERIEPLFVLMGDLRVCIWFGVVKNLVIDLLLGTSFINRCIRGVFPSERKIVL